MNRLQDDYDPYAVEEPSDEEPALSRWAAAPRGPPGLGRGRRARRAARLARRSPRGAWGGCSASGEPGWTAVREEGVFRNLGGPGRKSSDGALLPTAS